MTDKGADLNRRVWTLFEKAGFKTKPNSNDSSEEEIKLDSKKKRTVDLLAIEEDLGVKIIGWNKARKKLNESVTTHFHDYEKLKTISKADSVLFISTEKVINIDDRQYAEKHGMRVWGEDELRYFETLVDSIGEYGKYEIIDSFGISTSEEKTTFNVLAIRIHQPFSESKSELFLFTITPDKLLKTCTILRKARGSSDAYQRILNKSRLRDVKDYVTQEFSLLPPNIIVHLSEKVVWNPIELPTKDSNNKSYTLSKVKDYEIGYLSIPLEFASLELIDGQHRLYGFVNVDPATKQNFNLVVVGLSGLSNKTRRDVFVSINDKARRVDPNLVAYLKYTDDEYTCQGDTELMAIKIAVDLNRITPFLRKIRLLDFGDQTITLKGFSGYDLRGLLGVRGLLRKHYDNNSIEYGGALRLYFSVLKSTFPTQWNKPDKYIMFTNRGISAFLKLLRSILKTCQSPLSKEILNEYFTALKTNWTEGWETSTLRNSYVGSKGWKDFHRDLVAAIRKSIPDFKE